MRKIHSWNVIWCVLSGVLLMWVRMVLVSRNELVSVVVWMVILDLMCVSGCILVRSGCLNFVWCWILMNVSAMLICVIIVF